MYVCMYILPCTEWMDTYNNNSTGPPSPGPRKSTSTYKKTRGIYTFPHFEKKKKKEKIKKERRYTKNPDFYTVKKIFIIKAGWIYVGF